MHAAQLKNGVWILLLRRLGPNLKVCWHVAATNQIAQGSNLKSLHFCVQ